MGITDEEDESEDRESTERSSSTTVSRKTEGSSRGKKMKPGGSSVGSRMKMESSKTNLSSGKTRLLAPSRTNLTGSVSSSSRSKKSTKSSQLRPEGKSSHMPLGKTASFMAAKEKSPR